MEINVFELVNLLLRKLWVLLLTALICASITGCYSFFSLTPLYTSTTSFLVNNTAEQENKITASDISASESLVNNVVEIISSRSVLNEVYEEVEELSLTRTYEKSEVKNMLSTSIKTNTVIVEISIQCEDPDDAKKIAQLFYKHSSKKIEEVIEKSSVKLLDEANTPKDTSFPNHKTYIIFGFLAGFVISAIAVTIIDILDTKIDSEQDFVETFPDIPIIGVIPHIEEV